MTRYEEKVGVFADKIARDIISKDEVMKVILEKIQDQWKTIRKSFHDISKDTRGQMQAEELKFYLNHWGIHVNDETFN